MSSKAKLPTVIFNVEVNRVSLHLTLIKDNTEVDLYVHVPYWQE